MRPVKEKALGTVSELTTSNPGTGTRGGATGMPERVCKGADDVSMGNAVAERNISDAESISGDEIREPRRKNSPSDPTSTDIENHVLAEHASFRSWCAACVQGRGRAERHQARGRKELDDGSKIQVLSWDYCFLGARNRINEAEVEQRGDSPVLVMHDGVTK